MKTVFTLISLFLLQWAGAQSLISGRIYREDNQPLGMVKVSNSASGKTVYSDTLGRYSIAYVPRKKNILSFNHPFYKTHTHTVPPLYEDELYRYDVVLDTMAVVLKGGGVTAERTRKSTIEIKPLSSRPSVSGDFADFIKTQPGVSSNNELSAQYNVRGGSYDENLIYVNDIEIYRPQLIRSGQQEGLSFINPDLVSHVSFSAGGFEARFGDKLSSVLDVTYRSPKQFASGVQAGMLGASFFAEGLVKARRRVGLRDSVRFTYIMGGRYRALKNVLNSLDAEGLYQSRFGDFQSLITWHFNPYHRLELLLNLAGNSYLFAPEYQETTFGTLQSALRLQIGMDGQEIMKYSSSMGAVSYIYNKRKVELKFMASGFVSSESEHYDIEGAYNISELDNNLGSGSFGDAKTLLGNGYFINHARNNLYFTVFNLAHQGNIRLRGIAGSKKTISDFSELRHPGRIIYGLRWQAEEISDRFKEWKYSDSAGYHINPFAVSDTAIFLRDYVRSKAEIRNNRLSAFAQWHQGFGSVNQFTLTAGARYLYSSLNEQSLFSPRVQLYFEPNKAYNHRHKNDSVPLRKNLVLKAAYGYYYQAPFYREMRGFDGSINKALKAQRSIHYTAGADFGFKMQGRAFRFSGELFFKDLDYQVPYILDNIRIRYYANNNARGYAAGFDTRVYGEFIKGLESWFSLSMLKTDEIIRYTNSAGTETETPYLRRPTDRRVSVAVMFQDELKTNKDYRMHLMLNYGSSLPYYLGGDARYTEGNSIPAYRRVDIGFSKMMIGGEGRSGLRKVRHIRNLWIGADVFNLLQINNVISYLWVKDFSNNTYGVPNYLTGRRLNLRLVCTFQ